MNLTLQINVMPQLGKKKMTHCLKLLKFLGIIFSKTRMAILPLTYIMKIS